MDRMGWYHWTRTSVKLHKSEQIQIQGLGKLSPRGATGWKGDYGQPNACKSTLELRNGSVQRAASHSSLQRYCQLDVIY